MILWISSIFLINWYFSLSSLYSKPKFSIIWLRLIDFLIWLCYLRLDELIILLWSLRLLINLDWEIWLLGLELIKEISGEDICLNGPFCLSSSSMSSSCSCSISKYCTTFNKNLKTLSHLLFTITCQRILPAESWLLFVSWCA